MANLVIPKLEKDGLNLKAVRKLREEEGNTKLVEVEKPKIKDKEVLLKIWAGGICGSDLLIEKDKHFYEAPVTLGHEFSGIVEEVGAAIEEIEPGDRIAADIETEEGWLGVTRDGAFAPYMAVPEEQALVYPEDVSLDHICFTEPVVATIHSLQETTTVEAGDFVVVVGPGPMGLLGVQFAKLRGADEVALIGLKNVDEARLKTGEKTGADHILYSEEDPAETIMDLTDDRGADLVLEASASEKGVQHAIDCARKAPEGRGGRGEIAEISLWGEPITLDLDPLSLNQLSIHGAWSWRGTETWRRAVTLITKGVFDLDPLITNRYDLNEWKTAFERLNTKKDIKAFIHWICGGNWKR
ncbi:hypothetical protein AKJ64_04390 [candidate division MSBL1 archaeon SCGC-AAA259E17]|uniref:Enoyl reductase (ER) domain-containing protein n=1 Tax=candidate division MSBL1 archaeon SCGC-AAA259E17 TaxID=1698263 RepID=A0A133UCI8_9EURY|nr:hypothetical protein AKJ64_04390 [candidate division MSBL1 archaeon SCGC-AAA259E17]